ncbi:Glucokinase [bioreactor metagenome]|uniref:Glucokinase n=1 Tax=bioreactor metagenome TaxID=1076179 RepID=A0A645HLY9_9ZZZZ
MGMHGEIGHMITHADGRPCSCGQNGCWEMYAAASKLREASQGMSVREVMNNVRAGRMIDIWENYIHEVVIGLSSLMMIFAPEVIAIGGGLSNAGSIVIDTLRAEVEKTSAFNTFNPFTRIVSAHFQNDAGILGAAALASMME